MFPLYFLYLYPPPPGNTALPSSLSQKDGDPPEHTVRHRDSCTQKAWDIVLQGQRTVCNVLPRTQHARWLSCSAQQGQILQQWPQPGAPPLFSSAVPRAHDPHRYVHQNWPSKLGTWWVSAEQGSYLVLGNGRWTERQKRKISSYILIRRK